MGSNNRTKNIESFCPSPNTDIFPIKQIPTIINVPNSGRSKQRAEPARTSKTTQKLVVFPDANVDAEQDVIIEDEQFTDVVKTAHGSYLFHSLRRVTAYLTAESIRLRELQDVYIKSSPNFFFVKRFDEVLYAAYSENSHEKIESEQDLEAAVASSSSVGEILIFDYGVIVIWGLEDSQEKLILHLIRAYEVDQLSIDDIEVENFLFCHNPDKPPRLFNDVINLRSGHHMVKLTISHALAQSVKLAYFEELIENTIVHTKSIPHELSSTGTIKMTRKKITNQIGELFIMRMNVNLISNVLDTPEIFWSFPSVGPLYRAVRSYLEISQRIEVLNQRCAVLSDMLDMLRDHVNIMHGEKLEWIIIILITIEILMGIIQLIMKK